MAKHQRGQDARAAIRRVKALDLRLAGAGYRAIGKELKVSHVQAFRDVDASLKEIGDLQAEKAERLREIELARLDRATLAIWNRVRSGDDAAIRSMCAIMDRRAKLCGLDKPSRVSFEDPNGAPIVPAVLILPANGR